MVLVNDKKGELATKTIIEIVLLIAGFGIILLVVFLQFNWGQNVDKEVCHQSVIFRATLGETIGMGAGGFVPLKCRTSKICITSGFFGGKCEEYKGAKGVQKAKVKSKTEIEKKIAQEVVDCWSMMGEGRVSVFSQYLAETYGLGTVYPSCVICSRIAFDEKGLDKANIELNQVDVKKYMKERKIPGGEGSYIEYLAGESPATIKFEDLDIKEIVEKDEKGKIKVDEQGNIVVEYGEKIKELENLPKEIVPTDVDNREIAVLFMQISAPGYKESALNIGKTLGLGAGGSFLAAPFTTGVVLGKVGSLVLSHPLVALAVVTVGAVSQQSMVAYNRFVTAGYCGDISTGEDARNGCSVVRVVKYDENDISQYCSVIDSIG